MSEISAVTNLFSNIFATVVIAKWMGELDEERARLVLDGDLEPDSIKVAPYCGSSAALTDGAARLGPVCAPGAAEKSAATRITDRRLSYCTRAFSGAAGVPWPAWVAWPTSCAMARTAAVGSTRRRHTLR
jgi:hypothetical protein